MPGDMRINIGPTWSPAIKLNKLMENCEVGLAKFPKYFYIKCEFTAPYSQLHI